MIQMAGFKKYYRSIFQSFGFPLTSRSGVSSKLLADCERRDDVRLPAALREYYLVAGRERRFNQCYNRLLLPPKWKVDRNRLFFMEENQWVVWWSIMTRKPQPLDPPVWQGINDEPIAWYREHQKCSVFLAIMLHYQAVNDGFAFCGSASAPSDTKYRLRKTGWKYWGRINDLRAFSRPNQAVCVVPFMGTLSILAGAKTQQDLKAIELAFNVRLG
jgi:hypothetical protein